MQNEFQVFLKKLKVVEMWNATHHLE